MEILEEIKRFADKAHGGQLRKYTPERYIAHPVRVMQTCSEYDPRLTVLGAALLHDVLEDTGVNEHGLSLFLNKVMDALEAHKTLLIVKELTDVYVKEAYPHWNRKKRKAHELERIRRTGAEAQTIKYADILDNTAEIMANDPGFAPRYLRECLAILEAAGKGNPQLRALGFEQVKAALHAVTEDTH